MQTFLPSANFVVSASALDKVRLNKQITECYQLLNALLADGGWKHHPAAKMWIGYEGHLVQYARACYREFVERGGKVDHKSWLKIEREYGYLEAQRPERPPWLGWADFHSSHRGRLLHKGNLDIVAKHLPRKPEAWIKEYFGLTRKTAVRDLTVAQAAELWCFLECEGTNWYDQFGWSEQPSDDYIWPVETKNALQSRDL